MDLHEHYNDLWENSLQKFKENDFNHDNLINDKTDTRRGITLLIRPTTSVKKKVEAFLKEIKEMEPDQYYYPNSDIHLTIMSIISCYEGFKLSDIKQADYITLVQDCLTGLSNISINFKGITASESGVMIQGFPKNDALEELRSRLRRVFKSSPLQQTLDKRYNIQTAHLTVMRFTSKLQNKSRFIDALKYHRDLDFGCSEDLQCELVFNDWYQRLSNTRSLKLFDTDKK